jgi:hypothetical protein
MKVKSSTKTHKTKKIKSIKSLTTKADLYFSRYIRLRDKGICITCGKQDKIENTDCGHYITRACKSTRWNEKNCACQCRYENRYREGVKDVFALKLQEKYGERVLQELNDKKNQIFKLTPEYLERIVEIYKNKVKELGG